MPLDFTLARRYIGVERVHTSRSQKSPDSCRGFSFPPSKTVGRGSAPLLIFFEAAPPSHGRTRWQAPFPPGLFYFLPSRTKDFVNIFPRFSSKCMKGTIDKLSTIVYFYEAHGYWEEMKSIL